MLVRVAGDGVEPALTARHESSMMVRLLRIAGIAAALSALSRLSQHAGEARGNEEVPGIGWTLGVLAFFFAVRAMVTERTKGAEANFEKDLLWGLTAGSVVALLLRLQ